MANTLFLANTGTSNIDIDNFFIPRSITIFGDTVVNEGSFGAGQTYYWGMNDSGQFGDGTSTSTQISIPTYVKNYNPSNRWGWYSVCYSSLAVASDGTLWAWGSNINGALGDGTVVNKSSPVQIGNLNNWLLVKNNSYSSGTSPLTMAITSDGKMWAWGTNGTYQVGDGFNIHRSSPVQVGALVQWKNIFPLGGGSALAIRSESGGGTTLWGWGNNGAGELGIGATGNQSSPVVVGSSGPWLAGSTVTQVAGGNQHWLALTSGLDNNSGPLWTCGSNSNGQMGINSSTSNFSVVQQIGALVNWSFVAAGPLNSASIKNDGTLWTWGNNANGELGQNVATANISSPIQVGLLTTWKRVLPGQSFMVATKTDGTLWGWGNGYRVGDGSGVNKSSPVQIATSFSNKWRLPSYMGSNSNTVFAILPG